MKIRVKATANVLTLRAGEVAMVDTSPYVDTLVNFGWLIWLDRPEDVPLITLPPASERGPINRKGADTVPEIVAPTLDLAAEGEALLRTMDLLDAAADEGDES